MQFRLRRLVRGPAVGLAFALAILLPGLAPAEGERPAEMPYETAGQIPMLSPAPSLTTAKILLTDDRLSPRRVVIPAGQTLVWHSVARHGSRIEFEREVAKSMVCHSLVNFSLDGDALRSAPLQTGDTASFCELRPGTYRYRVIRNGPAEYPTRGGRMLSSRLEGVIVVTDPTGAVAAR